MSDAPEVHSLALWAEDIDDAERARRMIQTQKLIAGLETERDRRDYDLFNLRLYSKNNDMLLLDLTNETFVDGGRTTLAPTENSKNNRAKAAIDTLASQVASTETRARVEVIDGDYRTQRRAADFQDFLDGLSDDLKLPRLERRAFMDSAVFESGVGVIQLYRKGDRVAAQRVLATELAIDPRDGQVDGLPRTIYRARPVPRDNVRCDFGTADNEEAIVAASRVPSGGTPIDLVMVYESWTLPTDEGAGDGWHIVALDIEGGELLVEQYEKPHHELVFFAIEERFAGVWGNSLMGQARDLQIRINANDFRIERATKVFHAQHLYADRAMALTKSKVTNELGTLWEGNGPEPPKQITFTCAAPELYQQIKDDGTRIFEDLGINLSSSNGQADLGLDASGAALREETVKLDRRNSLRQQRKEEFHIDLVRVAVSVVRDIINDLAEQAKKPVKRKKGEKAAPRAKASYTVETKGRDGLTRLDFNDVAVDEKKYKLSVKPASPVPTEPGGLMAYGQQMIDAQLWTPDILAEYMQDLDASGRTNMTVSVRRNFEKKFDALLCDAKSAAMPDEFTDFAMAMKVGLEFLNRGEEQGVSDKDLEKLRRYLRQVKRLDASSKAGAAPAAPAGNVAAPAGPGPPALTSVPASA